MKSYQNGDFSFALANTKTGLGLFQVNIPSKKKKFLNESNYKQVLNISRDGVNLQTFQCRSCLLLFFLSFSPC